ncbi:MULTISPECIES: DUF969 domain-containing protein [unclassified Novosphingobium]|uniref:DUF969 domain-containing protein n=1 Tax=unclassified Novosphingobium TaxID=2644732 RepID=UPI0025E60957|nr:MULTISPECIES: DUF969 domain-containing protein [unclassified Novosphingobium]HQV04665.1 DUF969 domain-containing protein [Novosphingobium sp.]
MNYWVLTGIAVMIGGFMLRLNALVVVVLAALVTGLAAGLDPVAIVSAFGKAFNDTRYVSVVWIVLPVIGLMEARGLQERARALIAGMKGATLARLLTGYLLLRQVTSAMGLTSIAGHAQTVRPLLAPMAVAAAQPQDEAEAEQIKAMAAATDNVGLFFGEDIFIAIGSILLMKGFMEQNGIVLSPFELSVWAIPTAIAAFAIHGFRIWRMGSARK